MKKLVSVLALVFALLSCSSEQKERRYLDEKEENMKLEVNMIVSDAKAAGDFYKKLLGAEIISQTDNEKGMNETMLKLGGVEVRVLDENKNMGMFAPAQVGGQSVGINLFVDDIEAFFNNAVEQGAHVLSPITEFPEIPAKNAVFSDQFNHLWVINHKY